MHNSPCTMTSAIEEKKTAAATTEAQIGAKKIGVGDIAEIFMKKMISDDRKMWYHWTMLEYGKFYQDHFKSLYDTMTFAILFEIAVNDFVADPYSCDLYEMLIDEMCEMFVEYMIATKKYQLLVILCASDTDVGKKMLATAAKKYTFMSDEERSECYGKKDSNPSVFSIVFNEIYTDKDMYEMIGSIDCMIEDVALYIIKYIDDDMTDDRRVIEDILVKHFNGMLYGRTLLRNIMGFGTFLLDFVLPEICDEKRVKYFDLKYTIDGTILTITQPKNVRIDIETLEILDSDTKLPTNACKQFFNRAIFRDKKFIGWKYYVE